VSPRLFATLTASALASIALAACGAASNTAPQGAKPVVAKPLTVRSAGSSIHIFGKASTAERAAAQARVRTAFAKLRACMHQNGANIPAPGAKRSPSEAINTTSPTYKAAVSKCRSILIAALKPKPSAVG
jgi:hypothetical protein